MRRLEAARSHHPNSGPLCVTRRETDSMRRFTLNSTKTCRRWNFTLCSPMCNFLPVSTLVSLQHSTTSCLAEALPYRGESLLGALSQRVRRASQELGPLRKPHRSVFNTRALDPQYQGILRRLHMTITNSLQGNKV